jgi:hypothetical protein
MDCRLSGFIPEDPGRRGQNRSHSEIFGQPLRQVALAANAFIAAAMKNNGGLV